MAFEAILKRTIGASHGNWFSLVHYPGIGLVKQFACRQTMRLNGGDLLPTDIHPKGVDDILAHNAKAKGQWFVLDRDNEYL